MGHQMKKIMLVAAAAAALASTAVAQQGPVELSTYADANGWIDVQKLTCAQLANTFQEDADMLAAWYSGWYNGLAKKHMLSVPRGKRVEHEVIVYCKANRDKRVIEAIAVVFKDERARMGIEMR